MLTHADHAPWAFWRLAGNDISQEAWLNAAQEARSCLQGLPAAAEPPSVLEAIDAVLTEGQFGPDHFRLSSTKRLYYALRPYLPAAARPILRRLSAARQKRADTLAWPIEDRYVRFQYACLRALAGRLGLETVQHLHFWPNGGRFALVLTHDIETAKGQRFVPKVLELEERYGFRSSFNFVIEDYAADPGLLKELDERGFEIGIHGLRHDGKSFASRETFARQAALVNQRLEEWSACGFRSPLTHRQPEWMQALEIEYDSSFFDTDPFEPMPGGTMSIWPFILGRFVELPYTLAQDHTLTSTMGERTPRLWLEKVAFIQQHAGMALLNAHPDYLQHPANWAVYEEFLRTVAADGGYWHALPRDVARWWRARAAAHLEQTAAGWAAPDLPGATIQTISMPQAGTADLAAVP